MMNFIRDNRSMCDADFAGANAHAFYDPPSTLSNTDKFISNTVLPALRNTCPGKPLFITESGWPSCGGQVGAGVASVNDELVALQGLNCAAQSVNLYGFECDDQLWKSDDNETSFEMWVKIQGFVDSC
ncbi:hypothetical protein B0H17DRAFT_580200 [Mycena rosella]|uniref:glucan endo-1,3-beta-D-glucosidase n=1 Tax=Mycena rosella TaxID=1033263 RepID=A0AAD7BKR5_MYCRO|nr:hypothetical protein B0H17DRAFT_580200 [Mycena rosella]